MCVPTGFDSSRTQITRTSWSVAVQRDRTFTYDTAFAGGEFRPGAAIFAELAGLDEKIRQADLVITGEGALDEQSRMGKGTGFVADLAARAGKRCLCLAGRISPSFRVPSPDGVVGGAKDFAAWAIVPDVATETESRAHPAECLRRLAARAAAQVVG